MIFTVIIKEYGLYIKYTERNDCDMKRPAIGVLPLFDSEKDSLWMHPGYMRGLEAAGAAPVMLSLTADAEALKYWAACLDGFLFTGGQDVDPAVYCEEKLPFCGEVNEQRDKIELLLFEEIIRMDKPVLGICRGLQFFNAVLGGTLYQDIPSQLLSDITICHEQHKPYELPCHDLKVAAKTPLEKITGKKTLQVNSLHHQGIKELAPGLRAAAFSQDGLIEAAYMPDQTFVLAVQWHPELCFCQDPDALSLFASFAAAAGNKK